MFLPEPIPRINSYLTAAYLLLVWLAFAWLYAWDHPVIIMLTPLVIIVMAVFIPRVLKVIGRISLSKPGDRTAKEKAAVFAIAFGATALILIIWLIACRPGGFAPDSEDQLLQALSGRYNDWHPAWHTLLFFTLPIRITGSVYSIFYFEDAVFCAVMAYMLTVVYTYCGRKAAIISWCYIMLNPFVCYTVLFPMKDTPFALACTVSAVLAFQILISGGKTGESWIRSAALGISLANAAILRHNGILFSGFLIVALMFAMKKKMWKTVLIFVMVYVAIRIPLYSAFDVQKPPHRISESTALSMAVMGNVLTETPELLDDETKEFLYEVASPEAWETCYKRDNYNELKGTMADTDAVERAGLTKILKMAWKSTLRSPKAAIDGFIDTTDIVYGMHDTPVGRWLPYFITKYTDLKQHGNEKAAEFIIGYNRFCLMTPLRIFFNVGTTMLLILFAMMAGCDLKRSEDRKRILTALSIFCYNFGTMLFLGGPDHRFFLVSFLVCPIFVILMLYKREPESGSDVMLKDQGEKAD